MRSLSRTRSVTLSAGTVLILTTRKEKEGRSENEEEEMGKRKEKAKEEYSAIEDFREMYTHVSFFFSATASLYFFSFRIPIS